MRAKSSLSREQVRGFDRWAIETLGIPGVVLMENAGRGAAERILEFLGGKPDARVSIFCGAGNNGGDGYVIARHLANRGLRPDVILCARRDKIQGDALVNLEIIEKMGLAVSRMKFEDLAGQVWFFTAGRSLLVDALFGTGLSGPLREPYPELIGALNQSGIDIAGVDIPSGLDCDSGEPLGETIKAKFTVTFAARKSGFDRPEARAYVGEVYCVDIGIDTRFQP